MLVYGKCECFVMHMLYVCVLCASCGNCQCAILHDLQFVNAGRGCNRRPYGRDILLSRSHDCKAQTSGCVAMGSAVLFILRFRLLLYSAAGFGVNRMQVVLSGFIVGLFCFVQIITSSRYGCMYFLVALVLVCVDVMVMPYA